MFALYQIFMLKWLHTSLTSKQTWNAERGVIDLTETARGVKFFVAGKLISHRWFC